MNVSIKTLVESLSATTLAHIVNDLFTHRFPEDDLNELKIAANRRLMDIVSPHCARRLIAEALANQEPDGSRP